VDNARLLLRGVFFSGGTLPCRANSGTAAFTRKLLGAIRVGASVNRAAFFVELGLKPPHDRGIVRTAYWATVAITRSQSGKVCVTDASSRFLRSATTEHGSGPGRSRWVVERTFAGLNQFRRLRVHYEKRADIHEAFLSLGCALICWHFLRGDWVKAMH
jgi:hypothetical protein